MHEQVVRPDDAPRWPDDLADEVERIRDAGIAGAGGAGFPTHAKWERADSTEYLLVNHQESEPNYVVDKWLGKTRAREFAELFDRLLEDVFDVIVVSAKRTDREAYLRSLEAETGGTIRAPEELPLEVESESGVVFAYTDPTYQYGMESVLLNVVADTVIGSDLPADHGWLVQNTETIYNVSQAFREARPVTSTYVHVDGNVPRHRFLEAPIGTPANTLLEAAGVPPESLPSDAVVASGGPGWCFAVDSPPREFGVTKATNGLLVLEESTVEDNTLGDGRIDVLESRAWGDGDLETEPTATLEPARVRIPLITNPAFEETVRRAEPVVDPGDRVETGQVVAASVPEGISIPQHASIDGTVTAVDETAVEIEAGDRF
ncbi:NADH dehydrogenase subunit [Natrarchaeobius sp. A-rgal3]|uniref:NADH dehydrogenase subunit n=1 Tax=Natrarchaeobius versutus TaxID=1679078 RepID=UPI00350FB6E0